MSRLLDGHQAADKSHDLCALSAKWSTAMVQIMLTRRGRISTMSSGTRKITALSFLAMEMANFAGKKQ